METVRKTLNSPLAGTSPMAGLDDTLKIALEEIGLSEHEIALYKTALTTGPRPASMLARGIRIQRTRVYDLLSSLQAHGLIEMVERNHVRYYAATPPDHLLTLIRDRREYVESHLARLEQAVPQLFANTHSLASSIESRTFRGASLVKEGLEQLLFDTQSIISIGDVEETLRAHIGLSRWATKFREKRLAGGVHLKVAVQGPPEIVEEQALLRETLSSPDIPAGVLTLATRETILVLELSSAVQATIFNNEIFCSVLSGLYNSWLHAVQRMS